MIAALCVIATSFGVLAEKPNDSHVDSVGYQSISFQDLPVVWSRLSVSEPDASTTSYSFKRTEWSDPKSFRYTQLNDGNRSFLANADHSLTTANFENEPTHNPAHNHVISRFFDGQTETTIAVWHIVVSAVIAGSLIITLIGIMMMRRKTRTQIAKLRVSAERNRYLFDNAPDMFCSIDVKTARILECNQTMADNLGLTQEEIIGKPVFYIYHEDSQEEANRCFQTFCETGEVNCEHLQLLKKDGGAIDVSLRATAVRDKDGNTIRSLSVWRDITNLRQAEALARSSHARFTGILDNVPEAIIAMDDKLDVQVFNNAAEHIFGYTADEIIGKPFDTLMPARFRSGHGRHIQKFTESPKAYLLMSERQDIPALKKDGTEFSSIASVIRSVLNGEPIFTVILQDVTERRAAENALREKTTSLSEAQRIANMGNWDWDIINDNAYWSDEVYRIFGLEPQQSKIIFATFINAVHPDDLARVSAAVDACIADPSLALDIEHRIIRHNGDERIVHHRGEVVTGLDHQAIRINGTVLDITDAKRTEVQLMHSAKLAIVGQMASGIAHELNQPLHIIRLTTDLASVRGADNLSISKDEADYFSKIRQQVDRMGEIINHMRVFARQENTAYGSFSPIVSIENALQLVEPQFQAEGIELQLDLPATCRTVIGAVVPLEQVLLNVLTNARQAIFAQRGSNFSRRGLVRIALTDDTETGMVAIAITDDAGGIPDAELDQVFDAFYTTKESGVGTGLGLSISSQIIASMNGSISVSNVDIGARFEIMLPVSTEMIDNHGNESQETVIVAEPARKATAHKVMVVDDEDLAVESLAEILRRRGYDVTTAGDGQAALELFSENPVDAVITDLTMPRMGGREMIRHLRDINPNLPIIVTTGQITVGEDELQVAKGATCIIKKPVSMQQIFQALEQAINV